jgi:hypothetical protein
MKKQRVTSFLPSFFPYHRHYTMSRHEQLPYTPYLQNQSPTLQSLKLERNHNKHKCTTTASPLQSQFVKPSLLCSALQTPPEKEMRKKCLCVFSLSLPHLDQSLGKLLPFSCVSVWAEVASTILHEATLLFYSIQGMLLIHGRKEIPFIATKPTTTMIVVLSSCGELGRIKR